ncbi:MAG: CapA family protein [Promethearchaeota archaeon]
MTGNKEVDFKRKRFAMPYSLKEGIGWLYRYYRGPKIKNEGNIQYIPSDFILNEIKPLLALTFIGDIMELADRDLIIDESVKDFAKGSDYLIGNFEGTITNEKRIFMDQRHKPQIMDALESLFNPSKTYLNIANNHGCDFGEKIARNSIKMLENRGFNVFGIKDNPFIDINENIRIISGTQWSNRPCKFISKLEESERYIKPNILNILFPHWGYETELFPRLETIRLANFLLTKFDAIIGHHSHTPQPITYQEINNIKKLIAYSLGDFSFGLDIKEKRFKVFRYGIVLKVDIGEMENGKLQLGHIKWHFVKTRKISEQKLQCELTNKIKFKKLSFSI